MGVPEMKHGNPTHSSQQSQPCFSLIRYPDEVSITMAFAFFMQVGRVHSISLDGDMYNLSGMLLVCMQVEAVLGEVEREFGVPRGRWSVMKQELDIKEHEMWLLEEQVMGSNAVHVCPSPFFHHLGGTVYRICFCFVLVLDQDRDGIAQTTHCGPEHCHPDCRGEANGS